jgi:hypothetical protein
MSFQACARPGLPETTHHVQSSPPLWVVLAIRYTLIIKIGKLNPNRLYESVKFSNKYQKTNIFSPDIFY